MKKIYNICFLIALLAFVSCSPEEDDVFGKSAAERIDAAIKEDLSVLTGAKNGWVMEYYPSTSKMFGGYTILLSFDSDGTTSVSCDLFTRDKVATSQYEVKQSTGPMLTFDTYNEIFHFFSEPSNFLGIGETGSGMEGDYEFLILECTPEKVVLKGKKTGNEMMMTPIPENTTWEQYLGNVIDVAHEAYPALYDVRIGNATEYTVTQKYHMFILENKDGSQKNLPFVYTSDGIKFLDPIIIGAQQVESLTWDKNAMAYTNGNISIAAQELPVGYKKFDEFLGEYVFVYYNGEEAVNVELTEELFNSSFIMTGFSRSLRVVYKSDRGVIGLESQSLGGNLYFCPWSLSNGGSLTNTSGVGMEGVNMDNGIILFQDNGVWGKAVDSFVAFDLVTNDDLFQIPYVVGMQKK